MTVHPDEDMDVFEFMEIHPIVVDTFYSKPHISTCCWYFKKSEVITKGHYSPERVMKVCIKFHGNPWLLQSVMDWTLNSLTIPWAMQHNRDPIHKWQSSIICAWHCRNKCRAILNFFLVDKFQKLQYFMKILSHKFCLLEADLMYLGDIL